MKPYLEHVTAKVLIILNHPTFESVPSGNIPLVTIYLKLMHFDLEINGINPLIVWNIILNYSVYYTWFSISSP